MNIINSNPADKVERPKKAQYISNFYSKVELNTLFEKSKNDPLELIILITAFYGLRRSEVLGLKWSSIDFENKTITIKHTVNIVTLDGKRQIMTKDKTKNKSSYRTLPLIDEISEKLFEVKKKQDSLKSVLGSGYSKDYLEYIFVNQLGDLIKPDFVSSHFRLLLKTNNLKHIRFHDLRHSCGSLLLSRGIQMKSIQEWLGHSNYSTTANIYAHLDSNSKHNSANALVNAFNIEKCNDELLCSNS